MGRSCFVAVMLINDSVLCDPDLSGLCFVQLLSECHFHVDSCLCVIQTSQGCVLFRCCQKSSQGCVLFCCCQNVMFMLIVVCVMHTSQGCVLSLSECHVHVDSCLCDAGLLRVVFRCCQSVMFMSIVLCDADFSQSMCMCLQAIWNWMDNYPTEFTDLQKRPNDELQGMVVPCHAWSTPSSLWSAAL